MELQQTFSINQDAPIAVGLQRLVRRYNVYRTKSAKTNLCVCVARDKKHALKIARQMFQLPRDAWAMEETGSKPICHNCHSSAQVWDGKCHRAWCDTIMPPNDLHERTPAETRPAKADGQA